MMKQQQMINATTQEIEVEIYTKWKDAREKTQKKEKK